MLVSNHNKYLFCNYCNAYTVVLSRYRSDPFCALDMLCYEKRPPDHGSGGLVWYGLVCLVYWFGLWSWVVAWFCFFVRSFAGGYLEGYFAPFGDGGARHGIRDYNGALWFIHADVYRFNCQAKVHQQVSHSGHFFRCHRRFRYLPIYFHYRIIDHKASQIVYSEEITMDDKLGKPIGGGNRLFVKK